MTPEHFMNLMHELLTDNPFAIRPFLRVAQVRFTGTVPTLAVTREASPQLLVNLAFLAEHCHSDGEVKAVILHEFLHILLRHTEGQGPLTPAEHLAMDAVINAIIHRQVGPEASAMMTRYYSKARGLMRLLRPPSREEKITGYKERASALRVAWNALYDGRIVVDDIRELAETLAPAVTLQILKGGQLLGNHEDLEKPLPGEFKDLLDKVMRTMDGGGIWKSPRDRGLGIQSHQALVFGVSEAMKRWEQTTLMVLKKHLLPDKRSRAMQQLPQTCLLPVLSPTDRRAFMQALWSPILPTSRWDFLQERPLGTAQVYLDVSGSMNAEMPRIIGLLNRLRRSIRMPFWAFSTVVAPARISNGALHTDTTGGTSLACVLKHIAQTRPEAAVIVTDGYIEAIPRSLVRETGATRIHTLLTRDGSPSMLSQAGLTYTQLPKVPA